MEFPTYRHSAALTSSDHCACEARIEHLAHQAAELVVENERLTHALTDLLEDYATALAHRRTLLRAIRLLEEGTP